MATPRPNLHVPGMVMPDGSLSKPLRDLVAALLDGTNGTSTVVADIAAVNARLTALEGGSPDVTVYGPNVYETSPGSFEVRATDAATDPLMCQIFGS